ncbi:MAG: hypothetical protein H7328_09630 [Bdellovibrio sp.]|nr:hypothetical protein [Bdellovibrio sp.]
MIQNNIFLKLIFSILITHTSAIAADKCAEISEKQMAEWMDKEPSMPSLSFLIKAKKLIDAKRSYSLSLGGDKRAHCYLGCIISAEVDFETANFVAWQKEFSDATDCTPKTHFEIADYDATIKGAIKGAIKGSEKSLIPKTKNLCADFCKKAY